MPVVKDNSRPPFSHVSVLKASARGLRIICNQKEHCMAMSKPPSEFQIPKDILRSLRGLAAVVLGIYATFPWFGSWKGRSGLVSEKVWPSVSCVCPLLEVLVVIVSFTMTSLRPWAGRERGHPGLSLLIPHSSFSVLVWWNLARTAYS